MKIAIIGAGFTGLTAALRLSQRGVDVEVFESEDKPGGLAVGFRQSRWKWSLEKHYHHWFTSDWVIRDLANEVGQRVLFPRPKTSTFIDGKVFQLDSPMSLLKFDKLSFIERLRTGAVLGYLKFTPFWKTLEGVTSEEFLKKYMGKNSWDILWEPLFEKKFASWADKIPASWFWARIRKRSASLGYPEGGFSKFAERIDESIHRYRGKVFYNTKVNNISKQKNKYLLTSDKGKFEFDKVICTLPSPIFVKLTPGLPDDYKKRLVSLQGIGAVNLLVALKRQFLNDGTYWLNVGEKDFPFLAVVEHTNFMDKKYYDGENIVYVGNYLPHGHPYYQKKPDELLKEFLPYLRKINPEFNLGWVNKSYLFIAPFAQPIIPLNYSKMLPPMETPLSNLYLANIQQVYPWDRGTNYAVELGNKVATLVISER